MPASKVTITRPSNYHEYLEEYESGTIKALSPAALRTKIRKFLETYNVSASSFQQVIGVNPGSYSTFMTGHYKDKWSALQNGTYDGATYFFWVQSKLGADSIVNKLKAASDASDAAAGGAEPAAGAKPAPSGKKPPLPTLEGYDEHEMAHVYLTPKEVRAEISKLKTKFKMSNADLARAVWPEKAGSQTNPATAVGNFLSKVGEFGGDKMEFYKPCARWLEAMRVHLGIPKTKKRKRLDEETKPGREPFLGINPNKKYKMCPGISFAKDDLGRDFIDVRSSSERMHGWFVM